MSNFCHDCGLPLQKGLLSLLQHLKTHEQQLKVRLENWKSRNQGEESSTRKRAWQKWKTWVDDLEVAIEKLSK